MLSPLDISAGEGLKEGWSPVGLRTDIQSGCVMPEIISESPPSGKGVTREDVTRRDVQRQRRKGWLGTDPSEVQGDYVPTHTEN